MKKQSLLILLLSVIELQLSVAQEKIQEKVIYKWEKSGLVYYSHIKPAAVQDFIKLDNAGQRIEDVSEEFGEIVEVVVRPKTKTIPKKDKPSTTVSKQLSKNRQEEARKRGCEVSQKNLATLQSGEVYDKDENGHMVPLTPEQLEFKRMNVQRDVEYFCK